MARLGGVVGVRRRGACVLPPQAGVRGVVGTDGQAGRLPWRRLNGSLGPVAYCNFSTQLFECDENCYFCVAMYLNVVIVLQL